jgi:hypothetical protein
MALIPIEYEPIGSETTSAGGGTTSSAPVVAASTTDIGAVYKAAAVGVPSFAAVADAETWCAALRTALIASGALAE